ncbi:MAG: hydroxyacylglutathione hydrolase [Pseudomonadota bacterium]|nr:hydroxyacylglutathione hydrolase [Pseudomonadota bacterium]
MARGAGLEIVAVPAFADNYLWLVHDRASGETAVVDPGDAAPVLAEAEARGWRIGQVWNTHWHPDHTGGNGAVVAATSATLSAPAAEASRIGNVDVALNDGDTVRIGAHRGEVWAVPGHTLGHIAFIFHDAGLAFVGDTMFVMGCGRLFEGTPAQMFASFERLGQLPGDTLIYCAHEYTLANARFAAVVEPDNVFIAERLAAVEELRARGAMTVPTSIAAERATNPFMRAVDVADFAERRAWKDEF